MNSYKSFKIISYIEGLSYIILVFIAMPMKYLAGFESGVKYLGMGHGVLFILFIFTLVRFSKTHNLEKELLIDYFIYSLTPFGYLLIESSLKNIKRNFHK